MKGRHEAQESLHTKAGQVKAAAPKHGSGKTATDTGYVGTRRVVDGTETTP